MNIIGDIVMILFLTYCSIIPICMLWNIFDGLLGRDEKYYRRRYRRKVNKPKINSLPVFTPDIIAERRLDFEL